MTSNIFFNFNILVNDNLQKMRMEPKTIKIKSKVVTPLQIYFIIEVSLNLNTINTSFVLISNHTNEGPLPYLNACEPVHNIPITWSAVGSPSAASVVNKEYSHAILSNYFTSLYCQFLFTLVYGWLWSSINISQQFLIFLHGSGEIQMPFAKC